MNKLTEIFLRSNVKRPESYFWSVLYQNQFNPLINQKFMKGITFRGMRQHRNSLEPVDQLYRKVSENNFYAFMNPFPYPRLHVCLSSRSGVCRGRKYFTSPPRNKSIHPTFLIIDVFIETHSVSLFDLAGIE